MVGGPSHCLRGPVLLGVGLSLRRWEPLARLLGWGPGRGSKKNGGKGPGRCFRLGCTTLPSFPFLFPPSSSFSSLLFSSLSLFPLTPQKSFKTVSTLPGPTYLGSCLATCLRDTTSWGSENCEPGVLACPGGRICSGGSLSVQGAHSGIT